MKEQKKSFTDTFTDLGPFFFHMTGLSYCDGTYHIVRENSPVNIFEYVISGKGTVVLNSKAYPVSKGDVYFLQKGTDHEYYADPEDPFTKIWFNIYGDLAESLLKTYNLSNCVVIHNCGDDICNLFKEMVDLSNSNQDLLETFKLASFKFHEIVYNLSLINNSVNSDISIEALTLKQYLDNNVFSPIITINELSKSIFRSSTYTTNLFKREFGITPYQYLLDRKIDAAKHLLKYSPFSIKEIALKLCFTDQHYFTNIFKNKTGMTPSDYRKQ